MKFKTILSLAAVALLSLTAQALPVLTLHKRNTIVLRDVITYESVAAVEQQAINLSQNLNANDHLYLYLDTPGGVIDAGEELISTLKGLPQRVTTVTSFAASMGFITVQSLGTRYILPNGTLMTHRAYGGAEGQIPGELNTRVKFYTKAINEIGDGVASRIGMSSKAYHKLIMNEHWVKGTDAVKEHMADRVILVRCDKELATSKVNTTVETLFGPVDVTYSACPLISAPLAVNFKGVNLDQYDESPNSAFNTFRKTILELLFNKKAFYTNYIVNNKFHNIIL